MLVVVIDSSLDVFGVDGHNPLIAQVVTTRILNPDDLGPFYVMSLPSGLSFNAWTSS